VVEALRHYHAFCPTEKTKNYLFKSIEGGVELDQLKENEIDEVLEERKAAKKLSVDRTKSYMKAGKQ